MTNVVLGKSLNNTSQAKAQNRKPKIKYPIFINLCILPPYELIHFTII